MFAKAEPIFRRLCGNGVEAGGAKDPDIERLREHFRARVLCDRRETSSFGKSRLGRLREELNEFAGPRMKPCIAGGVNRAIAFSVTGHVARASAQEALPAIDWITTTNCSAG
jgi:hypothetical protein